jgi:hypothetical protein
MLSRSDNRRWMLCTRKWANAMPVSNQRFLNAATISKHWFLVLMLIFLIEEFAMSTNYFLKSSPAGGKPASPSKNALLRMRSRESDHGSGRGRPLFVTVDVFSDKQERDGYNDDENHPVVGSHFVATLFSNNKRQWRGMSRSGKNQFVTPDGLLNRQNSCTAGTPPHFCTSSRAVSCFFFAMDKFLHTNV